jgi:hypothetical protein
MSVSRTRTWLGLLGLLGAASIAGPAQAETSGQNQTHDPSRMMESGSKLYVYSTGGGSKWSPDGLVWTDGPGIFPNGFPQWLTTLLPSNEGVWAPDVIYLNNQYYLYYAVASGQQKTCAIGLLTSPTLDTSSPDFKWTDRGLVVSNDNVVTYAAIDPGPVLDANGDLWLVWGGGYANSSSADSIWVTRLDNVTGLPSPSDPAKPGHPLEQGHKEGSYIHYHDGYYYLFWQTGGCCSGTASTYTINVARSQSITGPYGGDRVFYASNGDVHGPGHIGIYNACGVDRFTYHYYPNNTSVLGENELTWGPDGWPVAGASSTTPIHPCATTMGSGSTGGAGGAGGAAASASGSGPGGASGMGGMSIGGGSPTSGGGQGPRAASSSAAGAGAPSGVQNGAHPGCACDVAGSQAGSGPGQLLLVAGAALAERRRRRRSFRGVNDEDA